MRLTVEAVLGVVRGAVIDVMEVDPSAVRPETALVADLQADSLALIEIIELCEARIALLTGRPFVVADDDIEALVTVGDAVDYALALL